MKCELNTIYEKVFEKVDHKDKITEEVKTLSPNLIRHYTSQLDIVEVISDYVKLEKSGKIIRGFVRFIAKNSIICCVTGKTNL